MSGLLERIARRRRASASRRLGPPASWNGAASSWNGAGPSVESPPAADEAPVGAAEDGLYPEAGAALATQVEDASVTEIHEAPAALGSGVAGDVTEKPLAAPAEESVAPPVEEFVGAPPHEAPVEPAEEAPAEPPEEAPAEPAEEAPAEPPQEAAAPRAEDAPALAEQAPETEAPIEPAATPPEESLGEPSVAEPLPIASPPSELSLPSAPTFLERGQIRRRARYLQRLREVQLRDIGGFVLALYRFGRDRPDLLQAKLEGASSTERELRALEQALGEQLPLGDLRQAGIGGACSNCGAVYRSADRYCSWCGIPLSRQA